jgi:biotin carboxyl carrier protein
MSDTVTPLGRGRYLLRQGAHTRLAYAVVHEDRTWVFLEGRVHIVDDRTPAATPGGRRHDDAPAMAAPMPATVVSIAVKPGERVSRGDVLITLEAMKMELPITAPHDGVVTSIACRPGELVQPGIPLVELK